MNNIQKTIEESKAGFRTRFKEYDIYPELKSYLNSYTLGLLEAVKRDTYKAYTEPLNIKDYDLLSFKKGIFEATQPIDQAINKLKE